MTDATTESCFEGGVLQTVSENIVPQKRLTKVERARLEALEAFGNHGFDSIVVKKNDFRTKLKATTPGGNPTGTRILTRMQRARMEANEAFKNIKFGEKRIRVSKRKLPKDENDENGAVLKATRLQRARLEAAETFEGVNLGSLPKMLSKLEKEQREAKVKLEGEGRNNRRERKSEKGTKNKNRRRSSLANSRRSRRKSSMSSRNGIKRLTRSQSARLEALKSFGGKGLDEIVECPKKVNKGEETGKVGTGEAGTREVEMGGAGTGEVGIAKNGIRKSGTGEVGTEKVGTGNIGREEIGTGNVETGKVGARNVAISEEAVGERTVDEGMSEDQFGKEDTAKSEEIIELQTVKEIRDVEMKEKAECHSTDITEVTPMIIKDSGAGNGSESIALSPMQESPRKESIALPMEIVQNSTAIGVPSQYPEPPPVFPDISVISPIEEQAHTKLSRIEQAKLEALRSFSGKPLGDICKSSTRIVAKYLKQKRDQGTSTEGHQLRNKMSQTDEVPGYASEVEASSCKAKCTGNAGLFSVLEATSFTDQSTLLEASRRVVETAVLLETPEGSPAVLR